MVLLFRTHKCRLVRTAEFIQTETLKGRKYMGTNFHAWRSFNFDENTETIDAFLHE